MHGKIVYLAIAGLVIGTILGSRGVPQNILLVTVLAAWSGFSLAGSGTGAPAAHNHSDSQLRRVPPSKRDHEETKPHEARSGYA
jgi:hypothetical protein